jgi:hypothetical protein
LEISQILKDVAMDLGFKMALKQGHKLVLISMIYIGAALTKPRFILGEFK